MGRYFEFSGRSSRSEFWWFYLFVAVVFPQGNAMLILGPELIGLDFPDFLLVQERWAGLFYFLIIPLIAAGWRRVHDSGRPGFLSLSATVGLPLFPISFWLPYALETEFSDGSYSGIGADIGSFVGGGLFVVIILLCLVSPYALYLMLRRGEPRPNRYG